jgi:hypothetical protein
VTFAPVVLDERADGERAGGEGRIEIELDAARVSIGRGAEVGMAVAVIEALRGRR